MSKIPKFEVGQVVHFVNPQGVFWPEKKIIEIVDVDGENRYHYEGSDTPWYATSEDNLFHLEDKKGVIEAIAFRGNFSYNEAETLFEDDCADFANKTGYYENK